MLIFHFFFLLFSVAVCQGSFQCPSEYHCLAPSLNRRTRLLQITHASMDALVGKSANSTPNMNVNRRLSSLVDSEVTAPPATTEASQYTKAKITEQQSPPKQSPPAEDWVSSGVGLRSPKGASISYDELESSLDNHVHVNDVPRSFNDVLYLGSVPELFQTVFVSRFIPRHWFVPYLLPEIILKLCSYIIKFSGALGLLNLIPCVYFDGQHITAALLELVLSHRVPSSTRRKLEVALTVFGTILLAITLILSFFSMS